MLTIDISLRRPIAATAMLVVVAGCASTEPATTAAVPETSQGSVSAERSAPPVAAQQGAFAIVNGERVAPPAIPMGDEATVARILDEGKNRNQVMDHLTYLSEEIGPRLTGSTNVETANNWSREQFESWGLANAHLFEWGEIGMRFDRLPSSAKAVVVTNEDGEEDVRELRDLEFTWPAWSRGTDGVRRGPVVGMPQTEDDYREASGHLTGAWVLVSPEYGGRRGVRRGGSQRAMLSYFAEIRERMAAGEFAAPPELLPLDMPKDEGFAGRWEGDMSGRFRGRYYVDFQQDESGAITGKAGIPGYREGDMKEPSFDESTGELTFHWEGSRGDTIVALKLENDALTGTMQYVEGEANSYDIELRRDVFSPEDENANRMKDYVTALVLEADPAGFVFSAQREIVTTGGASGWRELTTATLPQDVALTLTEPDFDFVVARASQGLPVQLECNLACEITDGPIHVYNTIAEIPGTTRPDEVVIISAHLDSWNGPGSQGTTDNGTGSCVTLEAARILMAAGAKPHRTIRFILWTGEEQGLLGSAAYVESLSDEELANISAVFVDDGGTNYEGGLECVAEMADYLAAATAPINGQFISQTDLLDETDDLDGHLNVNVHVEERMPRDSSSDHASFNRVGVPGFFWDEVGRADYGYGWHTQNDKLDLAIPEYLMQSSTCVAVTAYNLACAPDLLPRQLPEEEGNDRADASGN